jgi:uncharacterized protein YbgA (DUF1722 family)/uncharacterized protein YbbK (DUF523 family)
MTAASSDPQAIRIGISACLLGQSVRFDGGHKKDPFLTGLLGRFVEWVPVCPEVECGLGTPRESMRLVRDAQGVTLLTVRTKVDLTRRMHAFARSRAAAIAADDLCGFVFKKDSPTCGLTRVKIYDPNGSPTRTGQGLFAAAVVTACQDLPVEEEGRLSDPRLREAFIERVFAYRRLRTLFAGSWSLASLVAFHTAEKLILLAHSTDGYRRLGRLVATARTLSRADLERRYRSGFMAALARPATPGRHANVLQHMAGYFKDCLDAGSKSELLSAIDDYRRGLVPLVVPITLLRHHVRVHEVSYLAGQRYLEPHPRELMLRNHV